MIHCCIKGSFVSDTSITGSSYPPVAVLLSIFWIRSDRLFWAIRSVSVICYGSDLFPELATLQLMNSKYAPACPNSCPHGKKSFVVTYTFCCFACLVYFLISKLKNANSHSHVFVSPSITRPETRKIFQKSFSGSFEA
jgi:hypothetical protein